MTEQPEEVYNWDLIDIHTPVNVTRLKEELLKAQYDVKEVNYLFEGFSRGFDIEYQGPEDQCDLSENIPFREVGSVQELWEKMTKEVQNKRFAGPYQEIPFKHFVQSPAGLVPKAGGQTRLIFHLSYDFKHNKSINAHIPKSKCSVKYNDFDHAIKGCLEILRKHPHLSQLWFGISDLKSAFRMILLLPKCWPYLILKAKNPETNQWRFLSINACHLVHQLAVLYFKGFQTHWQVCVDINCRPTTFNAVFQTIWMTF